MLANLKDVLGKESKWTGVSFSDLLSDEQVKVICFFFVIFNFLLYFFGKKKVYQKAITIVHPDKNHNKDHRQKYIAERVFYELNEAWKDYKNQHGIL